MPLKFDQITKMPLKFGQITKIPLLILQEYKVGQNYQNAIIYFARI
jgi:hypothetical protein